MTAAADGWELSEAGPAEGERTVLLLPGMFCTRRLFDVLLADPRWERGSTRLVAATPPGFGGLAPAAGTAPTVEGYAGLVAELADELGADVIAGHSYFANVAIEAAAAHRLQGRLLLISPCFTSDDEMGELKQLRGVCRVPVAGALAMRLVIRTFPRAMRKEFEPGQAELQGTEMAKSDAAVFRPLLLDYFDHLDRHGSLVPRMCGSGVEATVVRGADDEVGLADAARQGIDGCPTASLVEVSGAGHFVMTDQPGALADLIEATR